MSDPDQKSHGEHYPGPSEGGREEQARQQQQPEPPEPPIVAGGNAVGNVATPAPGRTDAEAPGGSGAPAVMPGGASAGGGTSGNEVTPADHGDEREELGSLSSLDPQASLAGASGMDAAPAGYDPQTAPSDATTASPSPEAALPGTTAEAATASGPRRRDADTRDATEIRDSAPGPRPERGVASS